MTTTDIDAIRKHIQLTEDWAEYGHVGDPNWHVARTLIKQVPALLDELAQTRIDRDERLTLKESSDLAKMVDAAREELAKTRAELDRARLQITAMGQTITAFPDADNAANIAHARAQRDEYRAELGDAKARISAAATVEVWTNEDGKRFVFADDLMAALDPNPEANPATTAEPASSSSVGGTTTSGEEQANG